jgi:hypothetical protein
MRRLDIVTRCKTPDLTGESHHIRPIANVFDDRIGVYKMKGIVGVWKIAAIRSFDSEMYRIGVNIHSWFIFKIRDRHMDAVFAKEISLELFPILTFATDVENTA